MWQRKVFIGMALAALVALLVAVRFFDPADGVFPFPQCPFRRLTGWDCPGCGSTRALHALLHGHPAEALRLNAALVVAVPAIGALILADRTGPPRLRRALLSPPAGIILVVLAIAWTVYRNLN